MQSLPAAPLEPPFDLAAEYAEIFGSMECPDCPPTEEEWAEFEKFQREEGANWKDSQAEGNSSREAPSEQDIDTSEAEAEANSAAGLDFLIDHEPVEKSVAEVAAAVATRMWQSAEKSSYPKITDELSRLVARDRAKEIYDAHKHSEEAGGDAPPLFADVAAVLAGDGPVAPGRSACPRQDGEMLLYAGQVNVLFGDPESGKTWVGLFAGAEALKADGKAAFLDLDHNGLPAIVQRLQMLGVPDVVLADPDRFRYSEPIDPEHLRDVVAALVSWEASVVVVDSIGELLPLLGLSSNSPDDFTVAHTTVLKPLARSGACVILIDHLAKNPNSRSMGPTGTLAKKRAVGGVSLRVVALKRFAPGAVGEAALTIHKDRHGALRGVCPASSGEAHAGTFVMTAEGACFIVAPGASGLEDGAAGLVKYSEKIAEIIAKLDELEVPTNTGRPTAVKALQAAMFGACNADLAEAVKIRKARGNDDDD